MCETHVSGAQLSTWRWVNAAKMPPSVNGPVTSGLSLTPSSSSMLTNAKPAVWAKVNATANNKRPHTTDKQTRSEAEEPRRDRVAPSRLPALDAV